MLSLIVAVCDRSSKARSCGALSDLTHPVVAGGGALTREKIVAAVADSFVCIADASKWVGTLGRFPLPVEVIPMASARICRQFAAMGGSAKLRLKDGVPLVTDNSCTWAALANCKRIVLLSPVWIT